jgi:hypothetical protein
MGVNLSKHRFIICDGDAIHYKIALDRGFSALSAARLEAIFVFMPLFTFYRHFSKLN